MYKMKFNVIFNSGLKYPEFVVECSKKEITKDEFKDVCYKVVESLVTENVNDFRFEDINGATHGFYSREIAALSVTPIIE